MTGPNKIISLKNGDLVTINGKRGTVGTVGGYAASYGENPYEAIKRDVTKPGNIPFWVNQEATVIAGDPGYYETQRQKWANAVPLVDGQQVWLDGHLLKVKYMGDYSDMVHFQEVPNA